jgi:hypothetical protein
MAGINESVRESLLHWQLQHAFTMTMDRELTAGYTEAFVFTTILNSATKGVQKVLVKVIPGKNGESEPSRHASAILTSSEAFQREHLVEQAFESVTCSDGSIIMFQKVAGGSLSQMSSLASFSGYADLAPLMSSVCDGIIVGWNPAPQVRAMNVSQFMLAHVRNKLKDDGQLRKWLTEQFGSKMIISSRLVFGDDMSKQQLLNPILLVDEKHVLGASPVQALVGNSHGDLHLENVLVNVKPYFPLTDYRLIDLSDYTPDAPLTRDPMNLFLSEVERTLPTLGESSRRACLSVFVDDEVSPLPSDIVGLTKTFTSVRDAGSQYFLDRSLGEEWKTQQLLSLCAQALVAASREKFDFQERLWFLELASRAATKWVTQTNSAMTVSTPFHIGSELNSRERLAITAAERIAEECAFFGPTVTTVAIVPPGILQTPSIARLSRGGWNAIIEFDPFTAETGGYAASRALGESPKLLVPTQLADYSRQTTTWIAAQGLADPGSVVENLRLPEWRRRFGEGLRKQLEELTLAFTTPLCVVVFGPLSSHCLVLLEVLLSTAVDRVKVICVADEPGTLALDYAGQVLSADADLVAARIPPHNSHDFRNPAAATLPVGGHGEVVRLIDEDRLWIEEECELLHSQVGLRADSVEAVGEDFYTGRRITWFELGNNFDIPRMNFASALHKSLSNFLNQRGTFRHTFRHRPGSGGTSLVRRVAWDLHRDHPVMVATRISDARKLRSRIAKVAEVTRRQVLVIVENTSEIITNELYDQLKADSTPVVLLLVSRRTTGSGDLLDPARVMDELITEEQAEFARMFSLLAPHRRHDLMRIGKLKTDIPVPFFYALTAFQENFVGLREYVDSFLKDIDHLTRQVVVLIALIHRYAGTPVPSSAFATILNLPPDSPVRFSNRLGFLADGLVLEEPKGSWRTTHSLVAEEILRQALGSEIGGFDSASAWKNALPSWCRLLIHTFGDAYPGQLPADISQILERLFITRDNRDDLSTGRAKFSELTEDIPYFSGRAEVFSELVAAFPDQPVFWQHYARLLGVGGKDHVAAREAMSKALALASDNYQLWHTKGILVRAELYDVIQGSKAGGDFAATNSVQEDIINLTMEALEDFNKSAQYKDDTDYPHLSTAEMCIYVLEFAKTNSGFETYAAFLTSPGSEFYRELLGHAEEALDSVSEMQGDTEDSVLVQRARARLQGIFDNYSGMLQGWRNILDRANGNKTPIRLRLARLYGFRSGGWDTAKRDDVLRAMTLLNENLIDTPGHGPTARQWMRAARHTATSLDRAVEVASYWVESDRSRDALFYDYVLHALLSLGGRLTAVQDYRRKLEAMRSSARLFPQRRAIYEWLGAGDGLNQLVHSTALRDWERNSDDKQDPESLRRITGRVVSIDGPTSGTIIFANGIDAFFAPSVSKLVANRDENVLVTALLGFSYDGVRAWSVKRVDPGIGDR